MKKDAKRQPTQDEVREAVTKLAERFLRNRGRITKLAASREAESRRVSLGYQKRIDPILRSNRRLEDRIHKLQESCQNPDHPGRRKAHGVCPDCRAFVADDRRDANRAHQ